MRSLLIVTLILAIAASSTLAAICNSDNRRSMADYEAVYNSTIKALVTKLRTQGNLPQTADIGSKMIEDVDEVTGSSLAYKYYVDLFDRATNDTYTISLESLLNCDTNTSTLRPDSKENKVVLWKVYKYNYLIHKPQKFATRAVKDQIPAEISFSNDTAVSYDIRSIAFNGTIADQVYQTLVPKVIENFRFVNSVPAGKLTVTEYNLIRIRVYNELTIHYIILVRLAPETGKDYDPTYIYADYNPKNQTMVINEERSHHH